MTKASCVVESGVVVRSRSRGAAVIPQPRRSASHDTAYDWTNARDVLIALPVPKPGARRLSMTAVSQTAFTCVIDLFLTFARADPVGPTSAGATVGDVAIEVVTGLWAGSRVAHTRSVRFPPAGRDGARWAHVFARRGAAELRIAVAALVAAIATLPGTGADRGISSDRTEDVGQWGSAQCRRSKCHSPQEATATDRTIE